MNINYGNNVNFGWSCETHKKIMEAAIKDMPQFEKYKDTLTDYVQRPDHDDIGFLANKHFYFGEKIKEDSFCKKEFAKEDTIENYTDLDKLPKANGLIKAFNKMFGSVTNAVSFLDFDGRNNAKAAYKEQIEIMDTAIEDEDDEFAIQNAARACHFLQDVAQPQHIEETTAIGKAVDLKDHVDYEDFAEANADKYTANFKAEVRNPRNSMRLFQETFASTKELGEVTSKNKDKWDEITQKQFNTAVQSTKEFLQNVSDQMGLEYRDMPHDHDHH